MTMDSATLGLAGTDDLELVHRAAMAAHERAAERERMPGGRRGEYERRGLRRGG